MMGLRQMVDTNELLKFILGQGHKVKGQCQICSYVKNNGLGYKSRTYDWIVVKLMYRVDIDATLEVTKGQGHKVNGQGQICSKMLKKNVWAINH